MVSRTHITHDHTLIQTNNNEESLTKFQTLTQECSWIASDCLVQTLKFCSKFDMKLWDWCMMAGVWINSWQRWVIWWGGGGPTVDTYSLLQTTAAATADINTAQSITAASYNLSTFWQSHEHSDYFASLFSSENFSWSLKAVSLFILISRYFLTEQLQDWVSECEDRMHIVRSWSLVLSYQLKFCSVLSKLRESQSLGNSKPEKQLLW